MRRKIAIKYEIQINEVPVKRFNHLQKLLSFLKNHKLCGDFDVLMLVYSSETKRVIIDYNLVECWNDNVSFFNAPSWSIKKRKKQINHALKSIRKVIGELV